MRTIWWIISICLTLSLMAGFSAASAGVSGTRQVKLVTAAGAEFNVATITFSPGENGRANYQIDWADDKFGDHFLSMRPFKCLEGPSKYWCRVPYPYENMRSVTATDLTDLEYDLLFIWKGAKEYGINIWNGVYYRLTMDGRTIVGTLHEMDMDKLSAPPEDGNLRPIRDADLEPGEPESHWLPRLIIE